MYQNPFFASTFISLIMPKVVCVVDLTKKYKLGDAAVPALQGICLEVEAGEFLAIAGPSGSGKTTLLNIIGGIDKPTSGEVTVFDESLIDKDEDFLADYRCNKVGFVFQSYNLVSTLTVAENIAFPMEWTRKPVNEIRQRVKELLDLLSLQHRANHFSAQLSGGEQQRVSFARALANDPPLLLADEPTGNLDVANGRKIVDLLQKLRSDGKTIIVSAHDRNVMDAADRRLVLEDGKLVN
jgi:putative ABC transport system ATP-binding protein